MTKRVVGTGRIIDVSCIFPYVRLIGFEYFGYERVNRLVALRGRVRERVNAISTLTNRLVLSMDLTWWGILQWDCGGWYFCIINGSASWQVCTGSLRGLKQECRCTHGTDAILRWILVSVGLFWFLWMSMFLVTVYIACRWGLHEEIAKWPDVEC